MTDVASSPDEIIQPTSVLKIADSDPLVFLAETSCGEAVKGFAERQKRFCPHACVIGIDGRFIGLVDLQDCLNSPADALISSIMRQKAETAQVMQSADDVAMLMCENDIDFIPVLNKRGRIAGVVHGSTANRYLVEELREDADRFAGITHTGQDDYFEHTVWTDFWRRFPWVLVLAIAGLAAGYVVHVYESALDALVILALYMPMVADTGGNVGTQSASLVTRVLTTGEFRPGATLRILWREARVAFLMAGMLFLFAFLKVLLISNGGDVPAGLSLEMIGLAIAVALAAQVFSATIIGAILPLVAVAARQDPAVISGPALTTIVDLTGLLLYFAITTSILGITVIH